MATYFKLPTFTPLSRLLVRTLQQLIQTIKQPIKSTMTELPRANKEHGKPEQETRLAKLMEKLVKRALCVMWREDLDMSWDFESGLTLALGVVGFCCCELESSALATRLALLKQTEEFVSA